MQYNQSIFVNQKIRNALFNVDDELHAVSHPVIRKEEGQYGLAVFVTHFTKAQLWEDRIPRPYAWAMADLRTGALLGRYSCDQKDFSTRPLDDFCAMGKDDAICEQAFYEKMFRLLDKIRLDLLLNHRYNMDQYAMYMDQLLNNVPSDLARYYSDLSAVDEKDSYRKS